jgi:hypothetical protein
LNIWKPAFVMFGDLFFKFLDPLYFGGCNFLIFNPFLTIVSVSNAPKRRGSSFVWPLETMEPSPWIPLVLIT